MVYVHIKLNFNLIHLSRFFRHGNPTRKEIILFVLYASLCSAHQKVNILLLNSQFLDHLMSISATEMKQIPICHIFNHLLYPRATVSSPTTMSCHASTPHRKFLFISHMYKGSALVRGSIPLRIPIDKVSRQMKLNSIHRRRTNCERDQGWVCTMRNE
jgi:hypothetical protein